MPSSSAGQRAAADYAVPEIWTMGTDLLPRNPNGKIMKRVLREGQARGLT